MITDAYAAHVAQLDAYQAQAQAQARERTAKAEAERAATLELARIKQEWKDLGSLLLGLICCACGLGLIWLAISAVQFMWFHSLL